MNRNDWRSMAFRTRVFARLQKLVERGPVNPDDVVARRQGRGRLQSSAIGRRIFGAVDPGVRTTQVRIDGRRAVMYRPIDVDGPLPIVVNYHGGGWVQGNPEQSAWVASSVAARTGAIVVSPVYRLAPEHPFPAAPQDAWAALNEIVTRAGELGGDADRVAVMGDSAGGNLAAVTALRARDEDGPELKAQVLIYPSVDLYETFESERRFADAPVLTSAGMKVYARLYLGDRYGDESPQGSPLRAASHAGLPPAFIVTAQLDPLRDNGSRYHEALQAAGTSSRCTDYPGAVHGFLSLPGVVPVARRALDDIVEFLKNHL